MAVDTANKRRGASSTGPWRRIAPLPDGSIANAGDRQQIVGRYPLAGLVVPNVPGAEWSVGGERLHWSVAGEMSHWSVDGSRMQYSVSSGQMHWSLGFGRLHYSVPEE